MCHLNLEPVVRVRHLVDRQPDHFRVLYFSASLMTEAPLGVNHDEILVRKPFGHLFNSLAVCLPKRVTRCEKDRERRRFWVIVVTKHGEILCLRSQAL